MVNEGRAQSNWETAEFRSKTVRRAWISSLGALSGVLALVIAWVGIFAAFYVPFPVSFDITILGFACYYAALAWRWPHSVRRSRAQRADLSP